MSLPKRAFLVVLASLVFSTSVATADYTPPSPDVKLEDTGDEGLAIALDLVLVRPLGLVCTVLGTGFFLVGLPFAAATHDVDKTAHYLMGDPARYTFERPLGHFE